MQMMFVLSATLLFFINSISMTSITPREVRLRRICRSCGELAGVVQRRLEHTALNPRVITVAGRIGPDGRPIPGRKIDYLSSESRYLDIFTDICEELDYNAKSACYLITNEYDDQLREWFNERREEGFLESFCFKELTECNKKVVEASMTDIELENYEEDKHLIDDDFMPEAKEENVKKDDKSNFMSQAIEKLLNIRDNALDLAEEIDQNVKKMIKKEVLENPRICQLTDKILKVEHYELFLKHWWLAVISILISFMLPIIFVISLQKRIFSNSNGAKSPRGSSKSTKKSTTSASKLKVPAVSIETSESEAAEADDEKSVLSSRKSSRSSRILASTSNENAASPVKKITKRNSKSQSDD